MSWDARPFQNSEANLVSMASVFGAALLSSGTPRYNISVPGGEA